MFFLSTFLLVPPRRRKQDWCSRLQKRDKCPWRNQGRPWQPTYTTPSIPTAAQLQETSCTYPNPPLAAAQCILPPKIVQANDFLSLWRLLFLCSLKKERKLGSGKRKKEVFFFFQERLGKTRFGCCCCCPCCCCCCCCCCVGVAASFLVPVSLVPGSRARCRADFSRALFLLLEFVLPCFS